jgi:hypothetical protein
MTQPASAYAVTLKHPEGQSDPKLVWSTVQQGQPVSYDLEPARNAWQRWEIHMLALLPIDHEL